MSIPMGPDGGDEVLRRMEKKRMREELRALSGTVVAEDHAILQDVIDDPQLKVASPGLRKLEGIKGFVLRVYTGRLHESGVPEYEVHRFDHATAHIERRPGDPLKLTIGSPDQGRLCLVKVKSKRRSDPQVWTCTLKKPAASSGYAGRPRRTGATSGPAL